METILKILTLVVMTALIAFGMSFLMVFPAMWAINYVLTPGVLISLFGAPQLTFWKALWLVFVCRILFKGSSSWSSKSE